jgi:hypothetical protein
MENKGNIRGIWHLIDGCRQKDNRRPVAGIDERLL